MTPPINLRCPGNGCIIALINLSSRRAEGQKSYMSIASKTGTARQVRDFPIATYSLVALNLVLYIGSRQGDSIDLANRYGLIPDRFEFLRLFTSIFLHFDIVHLLVNVIFLLLFGRKVEKLTGPLEFLLFYIGSGFTASLLHMAIANAFLPPVMLRVPVIGASGAVAGILGMYAVSFSQEKFSIRSIEIPSVYLLLSWLVIQAAFGIAGILSPTGQLGPIDLRNVGYWAHIGGFVFGMTAAWITTSRTGNGKKDASPVEINELRRKTMQQIAETLQSLRIADSSDPFVYGELGRVKAILGDQPASIENYLNAIELYRKEGKRDEAMICIRDALRFWPEPTLPHDAVFRFGCYFEVLGEAEEAARCFVWLADAASGKPEAEMALVKLAQVEIDKLNRPDLASEAIERLMKEYPESRWNDLAKQILSRING